MTRCPFCDPPPGGGGGRLDPVRLRPIPRLSIKTRGGGGGFKGGRRWGGTRAAKTNYGLARHTAGAATFQTPGGGGGGADKDWARLFSHDGHFGLGGWEGTRQPLDAANEQTAHPATFSTAPPHQLLGSATAETTRAVPTHRPLGSAERENDTSKSTGRSGGQNAATRRNMRREERVTVQGPVKKQRPDGMSHRGGGGTPPPPAAHRPSEGGEGVATGPSTPPQTLPPPLQPQGPRRHTIWSSSRPRSPGTPEGGSAGARRGRRRPRSARSSCASWPKGARRRTEGSASHRRRTPWQGRRRRRSRCGTPTKRAGARRRRRLRSAALSRGRQRAAVGG